MARSTRDRLLDAGTGVLLLGALGLLVQERVLPAVRAPRAIEVGQALDDEIPFEALASGDTVSAPNGAPTLLMVLQSTCPACRAVAPAWSELLRRRDPGVRVLAVALEPPEPGLAYVREHLDDALAVRPLSSRRFLEGLQIRAVPTTLVLGADRRLRYRRSGLLDDVEAGTLLRLVGAEDPSPAGGRLRADAHVPDPRGGTSRPSPSPRRTP